MKNDDHKMGVTQGPMHIGNNIVWNGGEMPGFREREPALSGLMNGKNMMAMAEGLPQSMATMRLAERMTMNSPEFKGKK